MTPVLRRLLVLHEPESACRRRLEAAGVDAEVAGEVAFYLAQATDFAAMLGEVRAALAAAGVELAWAALDERERWLSLLTGAEAGSTMLWSLTDGFAWYRGSLATSTAALLGMARFGSPPAAQHTAQDKFRCLALAEAVGLRVPPTVLVEGGEALSPRGALPAEGPYFVKPNTLGAKLGIAGDSRCGSREEAFGLCRRVWARYGDRALVQPYLPGRDVRVSFMDLGAGEARVGVQAVRTGGGAGFATLADSRRITRLAAADGRAVALEDLGGTEAGAAIAVAALRLARALGLRDYWSLDFRLGEDGTPWFLELEVAPAVTIYDFRTYLRAAYGCDLPEALARAVPAAFARRRAEGPGPW